MAQKYIDVINCGGTVKISDLTINYTEATSKEKRLKKASTVNNENYGGWGFTKDYGIYARDKAGEILYYTPYNNKNILLLPYIFDAFYGAGIQAKS